MERLDRLIVCETDKGNYAVRPMNWAGIWNENGKIKENGLNHIAIFHYKEDAEWYAASKNAEEQGLLLRLPCPVGSTVYLIKSDGKIAPRTADMMFLGVLWNEYGKEWFLTQEKAEQALKQMEERENDTY